MIGSGRHRAVRDRVRLTDRPGAERVELPYGSGQRMSLKSESNNPSNQDEREGTNKIENRMRMDMEHGHEGGGRNVTTATTSHTRHRPGLGSTAYFFQVGLPPGCGFYFPPPSLPRPKKSRHACGTPAPIGSVMPGITFRAGRRNFVKT